MSIKNNVQLKLPVIAQKGRLNDKLVQLICAPLFWILAISAIIRYIYYSVLLNTIAVDSASYLNFHVNILLGETDGRHTPVYPYFIKLISLFGSQSLIDHIVTAQILISFLSIILFYKIVRTFFKSRIMIFVASISYGAMLPIINFDKMVLTESLSVTFGLIFMYMMINYLQKPAHLKAWLLTLFVFIAIMLRPSFIYLLPLVIFFGGLRLLIFKKDRSMCLSGLAASVVVIFLILGYSVLNKRNNGFNGISQISNGNQMAVIVGANIYMYGNDTEISTAVKYNSELEQKYPGKHVSGINIMQRFDPDRVHIFIVNCIKNRPVAYMQYIGSKLFYLQAVNIFTNYAGHKRSSLAFKIEKAEYSIFYITFNILYFFILLDLILIIIVWIKNRQAPWFNMVLWLLICGQMTIAILSGYSEYQRLILAIIPALLIASFSYIDKIFFAIDAKRLEPS